jgi:hypothetical protein
MVEVEQEVLEDPVVLDLDSEVVLLLEMEDQDLVEEMESHLPTVLQEVDQVLLDFLHLTVLQEVDPVLLDFLHLMVLRKTGFLSCSY